MPTLLAEQFTTLAKSPASQPEFGSLRLLILAFSDPGAASMSVLWTASTSICQSLSTLRYPSQSLLRRRAALQEYNSTINAVRQALQEYRGSDLPLTTAVLLLALFELSVESDDHDTAWRHHLGGAQALAASLHPTGEARKGRPSCALRNAIFDLQDLASAMDDLFDSVIPPRKLDVRKLRVDVSKIHKQLLILQNARERGYADSKPAHTPSAALAWRLNLLTALVLTTRFLIDTSHHLKPSTNNAPHGARHNSLTKLRDKLLDNIATTASLLLSHGNSFDLDSLCLHLASVSTGPINAAAYHTPPNTIDTLTAIYPLALFHSYPQSANSPIQPIHLFPHSHCHRHQHIIPAILQHLAQLCSVPKAASLITQLRTGQALGYKQVLDATAAVAMGGALS